MKSAGKARSNGLYRHIRTSKEIIRNLLNYSCKILQDVQNQLETPLPQWYNYIVILWKLGAKPRTDRPQASEFLWDV